ncbi:hypothetical protein [Variovorax sp. UC74_104]|uniref:hypothetical protein n=1 Tax=Variovorax sp. UC74_104 TaxID=3374555 RepID=UPI0037566389
MEFQVEAFPTPKSSDTRTATGRGIRRDSTIVAWVSARGDKVLMVVVLFAVASWLFYWFGP